MLKRFIRRLKLEYTVTEYIHATGGAFWNREERREVRQQFKDGHYTPL